MMTLTREKILSFGTYRFVPSRQQLFDGDEPLRIGSRALGLLQALVENAGEIVTKDKLIESVWPGIWVDEANLRANISALRKVLGDGREGRRYVQNVPGRGYRFVEPVYRTEKLVAPTTADKNLVAQTVPRDSRRLIGRSEALEYLSAQLAAHRLVSVVGSGGVGKTTLAAAVAELLQRDRGEAAIFVDLTTAKDADQLWIAAATAFEVEANPSARTQVLRAARARDCLVFLDNCEHVIVAAAEFAEALLSSGEGVQILATSREPLRVRGEWVHRLSPLTCPEPNAGIAAREALAFSAVELLVERVAETVGGFVLTDRDAPFAAEICRRLDGVPLALELAAAQAEVFSMRQLADGLRDRFKLLSRGLRSALPRHQSLEAMLSWSCQLLSEPERMVLRWLSVFPAWFDMPDATEVGARLGMSAPVVSDAVANLVIKSIVTAGVTDEGVRYRLPETVRAYSMERLTDAGELDATFAALAAYVTDQYTAASIKEGGAGLSWLTCIVHNLDNARACLDWALIDRRDQSAGVELISKALPFWMLGSRLVEHRQYLQPALEYVLKLQPRRLGDELALEVGMALGRYYDGGPTKDVIAGLKRGLLLARRLSSKAQELAILWMLYGVAGNWGNYRAEMDFARQFSNACADGSERQNRTRRHRMLARALHDNGDHRRALKEIDQALAPRWDVPKQLDAYSIEDVTAAMSIRARILWITGRAEDAMAAAEECLARGLAVDHSQSICWAIMFNLCPVAIWCGDTEKANRFATLAMAHSEKTFEHWNEWAKMYRSALGKPDDAAISTQLLRRMMPAQKDIFATLWPSFAGEDIKPRAVRHTSWCSPELIRLTAARVDDAVGLRLLQQADVLAKEQSALAWRLRIATSLAKRHVAHNEKAKARSVLAPVYETFKQGFNSKDLRRAAWILASL
jgi:predicted ATPase/DNA-binding winged helix-turn-helix (wHTH) protein